MNPRVGSFVNPHRDSTYLYNPTKNVEPDYKAGDNIIGLWLALEDATLENSCLWAVKGSHADRSQGQKHPNDTTDLANLTPKRNKRNQVGGMSDVGYDEIYQDSQWTPLPVKKGTLVLIHGSVMHKSLPNTSDKSRHIITWHCIEGDKNCEWSRENWQQLADKNGKFKAYY